MPILTAFRWSELNECHTFIGVCSYKDKVAFKEKIQALCKAMGWQEYEIVFKHGYLNTINCNLEEV